MELTSLFNPEIAGRPMRVAGFMSGSGTNLIKLIEHEEALKRGEGGSPFELVFIFSDRSDGSCRGEGIALKRGIPYISYDIREFHRLRGLKRSVNTPEGMEARREFDAFPERLIRAFDIDVVALGGYMSYTTLPKCINVHPADLSITTSDGRRRFVGDHAVEDAILSGEKSLRSSTIWTDQGVDTGPLLMVSDPLPVELPEPHEVLKRNREKLLEVVDLHQRRLKEVGDWRIFPQTVEMIARGRFALDADDRVYVDGRPAPLGFREE